MKTKLFSLLLAGAVALSGSVFALAAAEKTITADEARAIAQKQVPKTAAYLKTKDDGLKYEVKFYDQDAQESFEVDVSKESGALLSFDSERDDHKGGPVVTLTEADAKKVVTDEFKGAKILLAVLKEDDGFRRYEVMFEADGFYGEVAVHPSSAKVLERDIQIGSRPTTQEQEKLLSPEKAKSLALLAVPGSVAADVDLERDHGAFRYEVDLYKDGAEYEVSLDAVSGEILSNSYKKPSGKDVGLEKAKELALARAPGAVLKEIKSDWEDGGLVYEGELQKGAWEYEFEIDAATGSFLEWVEEFDD